ncbi:pyridoxal-phosphate dependent enzyme [Flavobacteriaceae bacterium F08102]|nr:pyridoxal-phosphate dependent enzyme [Flavobacteriaceae bacterium F08102]
MDVYDDIEHSAKRLKNLIHHTPILTSSAINEMCKATLYFKCENFQKTGSFKMRGASNAVLQLSKEQQNRGVVTHSSGNFAQALALAGKKSGCKAYIVMPKNAPDIKKAAVKEYGGIITECEPTLAARHHTANEIQQETGATFVHPYNDYNVILGNATAGKELLEAFPSIERIVVPVGGGGLVSGIALSALSYGTNPTVFGAEPANVDDAFRSMASGHIEQNATTNTIADGLKTSLGDITFSLIKTHVTEIIRVSEEEIVAAMRIIWERLKIIVEPSSAVSLAAILTNSAKFKNQKVGVLLSGGNIDLKKVPF